MPKKNLLSNTISAPTIDNLDLDVPGCSNSSRYKDESSTNTAATVILSSDSDQSDFEKNEEDDIVILEPDEKDYLANDDDGLMATKQVESEVNPGGQAMLLGTFDEWIKVHNLLRQEMSSFRNRSGNILRYFCSRRHRSPKCIFCVFIVLMPKKQFRVYTVGIFSKFLKQSNKCARLGYGSDPTIHKCIEMRCGEKLEKYFCMCK